MYISAYLPALSRYKLAQTHKLPLFHNGLRRAAQMLNQRNIHSFGRRHDLYGLFSPGYGVFLLMSQRMNAPLVSKHNIFLLIKFVLL